MDVAHLSDRLSDLSCNYLEGLRIRRSRSTGSKLLVFVIIRN